MKNLRVNVRVAPEGTQEVLSKLEVKHTSRSSRRGLYGLLRRCAQVVLNCASPVDDAKLVLEQFEAFEINVIQHERRIKAD
jgi:hypothetical protein